MCKKIGMTHIFTEDGRLIAASVLEAGPCVVLQIKDKSVLLGFDVLKESRVKKPQLGMFKKINAKPMRFIKELPRDLRQQLEVGTELKADFFKTGEYVDVTGISIGKGFQGGMKRWNWKGGPETHGSTSHRRVGSMGSTTTPGRVWKGHHLPGHMGNQRVTVQNLRVLKVDSANNLLAVKGAVPGNKDGYLVVQRAKKRQVS